MSPEAHRRHRCRGAARRPTVGRELGDFEPRRSPSISTAASRVHPRPGLARPQAATGASAPSAPSWRGKRGQQVRRWLERRGGRAVRPRPRPRTSAARPGRGRSAEAAAPSAPGRRNKSPPDRLPGSSEAAVPLAFRCRSAVRNSFRGRPRFHPLATQRPKGEFRRASMGRSPRPALP